MRIQEHTSLSEHLQEEYSFTGQFTRRKKIGKLAQGSDLKKNTHTHLGLKLTQSTCLNKGKT